MRFRSVVFILLSYIGLFTQGTCHLPLYFERDLSVRPKDSIREELRINVRGKYDYRRAEFIIDDY